MSEEITASPVEGVLPLQHLRRLAEEGRILAPQGTGPLHLQPASLDLRLGKRAWRVQASFLPSRKETVCDCLDRLSMHEIDLTRGAVLETGCVYVAELQEELRLPDDIWGLANAKSTTGRLDVFTRLIADQSMEFDRLRKGYAGPLFAEISPRTFSLRVRQGSRLNQLRLLCGNPVIPGGQLRFSSILDFVQRNPDSNLGGSGGRQRRVHDIAPLVDTQAFTDEDGLRFSVDLRSRDGRPVGYRAKPHCRLIDIDATAAYPVEDFWEPVYGKGEELVLVPGAFYILASCEAVCVPPRYAAEMTPYLPLVGEFRVHYAGFFDPGFGFGLGNARGARGVLEVRCYETPFILRHEQVVGRLVFENMQEVPELFYGRDSGANYQGQGLQLARQFKPPAGINADKEKPQQRMFNGAENPSPVSRTDEGKSQPRVFDEATKPSPVSRTDGEKSLPGLFDGAMQSSSAASTDGLGALVRIVQHFKSPPVFNANELKSVALRLARYFKQYEQFGQLLADNADAFKSVELRVAQHSKQYEQLGRLLTDNAGAFKSVELRVARHSKQYEQLGQLLADNAGAFKSVELRVARHSKQYEQLGQLLADSVNASKSVELQVARRFKQYEQFGQLLADSVNASKSVELQVARRFKQYEQFGQLLADSVNASKSVELQVARQFKQYEQFGQLLADNIIRWETFRVQAARQSGLMHGNAPLVDAEAGLDTDGLRLSVDLHSRDGRPIGYQAKRYYELVDIDATAAYEVGDFWNSVPGEDGDLVLDPGAFYITLASREAVRVPPQYAPR